MPFKGFTAEVLPEAILSKLKPSPYTFSVLAMSRGETGAADCLLFPRPSEAKPGKDAILFLHRVPNSDDDTGWVVHESEEFTLGDDEVTYGSNYDLAEPADFNSVAFDYNRCGRMDHLFVWRSLIGKSENAAPISLDFRIVTWSSGWIFNTSTATGRKIAIPDSWIKSKEAESPVVQVKAFALDWESTGNMDHVVLYVQSPKNQGGGGMLVLRPKDGIKQENVGKPGLEVVWQMGIGKTEVPDWNGTYVLQAVSFDNYGRRDAVAMYGQGQVMLLRHDRTEHGDHSFEKHAVITANGAFSLLKPELVRQGPLCLASPLTGESTSLLVFGEDDKDEAEIGVEYRRPYLSMLEYNRKTHMYDETWKSGWGQIVGEKAEDLLARVPSKHFSARTIDYDGIGLETHVVVTSLNPSDTGTALVTAILLRPNWEPDKVSV